LYSLHRSRLFGFNDVELRERRKMRMRAIRWTSYMYSYIHTYMENRKQRKENIRSERGSGGISGGRRSRNRKGMLVKRNIARGTEGKIKNSRGEKRKVREIPGGSRVRKIVDEE
jgi:hypothetical protein